MVRHDGVNLETYHGWLARGRVPIAGSDRKHYMVSPYTGRKATLYSEEQTRPVTAAALAANGWTYEARGTRPKEPDIEANPNGDPPI